MTERQPGWYWVKTLLQDDWECRYWNGDHWFGQGMYHQPSEIGPRIPTPDEPWQTVPVEATTSMVIDGECAVDAGCAISELWASLIAAAPKPGGE